MRLLEDMIRGIKQLHVENRRKQCASCESEYPCDTVVVATALERGLADTNIHFGCSSDCAATKGSTPCSVSIQAAMRHAYQEATKKA